MLMTWPVKFSNPKVMLEIELKGRWKRRHLYKEPWQRGCIKIIVENLRRIKRHE